jgi:hypothetical protein
MTLPQLRALRIALGTTAAVAAAYGLGWPISYMMPLFAALFLSLPLPWFGWKVALSIIMRLAAGLLVGLAISETLLRYPLICVCFYALFFFYLYYNDATAPPLTTIFMTLGATAVPIVGLQGVIAAHLVAGYLFLNMVGGFVFTWLFHLLLPDSKAKAPPGGAAPKRPAKPPIPPPSERARLALVSTIVSTAAVTIFFTLDLAQYALAMIYICMMAGTPNTNASIKVMKFNAIACFIGGVAIIIAYNLLVCMPTYGCLLVLTLFFSLFFASKITSGKPSAAAWKSGFTTFLVLLGSSTGGDSSGSSTFYTRIAQILFAGLFTIFAIVIVEHMLRRKRWRLGIFRKKVECA